MGFLVCACVCYNIEDRTDIIPRGNHVVIRGICKDRIKRSGGSQEPSGIPSMT